MALTQSRRTGVSCVDDPRTDTGPLSRPLHEDASQNPLAPAGATRGDPQWSLYPLSNGLNALRVEVVIKATALDDYRVRIERPSWEIEHP